MDVDATLVPPMTYRSTFCPVHNYWLSEPQGKCSMRMFKGKRAHDLLVHLRGQWGVPFRLSLQGCCILPGHNNGSGKAAPVIVDDLLVSPTTPSQWCLRVSALLPSHASFSFLERCLPLFPHVLSRSSPRMCPVLLVCTSIPTVHPVRLQPTSLVSRPLEQ